MDAKQKIRSTTPRVEVYRFNDFIFDVGRGSISATAGKAAVKLANRRPQRYCAIWPKGPAG